jgi:hypothetical protein
MEYRIKAKGLTYLSNINPSELKLGTFLSLIIKLDEFGKVV